MNNVKDILLSNPIFGLLLTLFCYYIGTKIHKVLGWSFLQPIVIATIMIIIFLKNVGISFEEYHAQNQLLNYMLPVTAVALAIPLYKNFHILKRHSFPLMMGISAGTITTMLSVVVFGKLFGADKVLIASMLPKSATNPIAIEVSSIIGGIPSLTVALVVITGIFGGTFGPELLNLFRIKSPIARGIAIGSMSHAVGTARAFKEGEIEGAMSSLAMAISGTLTAILSPLFLFLFL